MLKPQFIEAYQKLCSLFGVTFTPLKQRQADEWFKPLSGIDIDTLTQAFRLLADRNETFPALATLRNTIEELKREQKRRELDFNQVIDDQLAIEDKDNVDPIIGKTCMKVIATMMRAGYSGPQMLDVVSNVLDGLSPTFAHLTPERRPRHIKASA